VDECATSNSWTDLTTYSNFHVCLRGSPDKWLTASQTTQTDTGTENLDKDPSMVLDNRLIIDGLAWISHRQPEQPCDYFSRLSELIHVLSENYTSYRHKLDRLAEQPGGGLSNDAPTKFANGCQKFCRLPLHTNVLRRRSSKCQASHRAQKIKLRLPSMTPTISSTQKLQWRQTKSDGHLGWSVSFTTTTKVSTVTTIWSATE
jgi:hypothetical protein